VQGSAVATAAQALVVLLVAPCSADAQQPRAECIPSQAQSAPSEDAIAAAVERALSKEALASLNGVQVIADSAVVTLKGQVRSLLAKERATHVAEAVKGVLVIDNQLVVRPRDVKSPGILEQAFSQALRNDAVLEAVEVDVHADRAGRVRVTGIVDSWAEREMIERAAKSIAGVTEVTNNVSIDATPTLPDAELAAEVERRGARSDGW
jgi:osmotically-inducible protein OsmY